MMKNIDQQPGRPIRMYDTDGNFRDYSTDEIVGKKLNFYNNWLCGAGAQNLFIGMDGEVWTASCKVGGQLGNVFEDFSIPDQWITCTKNICSCGADLFIPKVKTIEHRNVLKKTNGEQTDFAKRVPDSQFQMNDLVGQERMHSSTSKQIYWEIGRRCNYDCSYCWPWIHNNHERHKSLEELVGATLKLEEKFMKGNKVNFIISGGEPTANPAFLDWVRFINSFGHHLSLHSNGSRKPEYYQEIIKYGDLNLSAHFEFWKKDHFVDVVTKVTEEKIRRHKAGEKVGHLEIKLMMNVGNRDIALDLEQSLRNIPNFIDYCTWAIVPIRDGKMGDQVKIGYTEDDEKLFGDRK